MCAHIDADSSTIFTLFVLLIIITLKKTTLACCHDCMHYAPRSYIQRMRICCRLYTAYFVCWPQHFASLSIAHHHRAFCLSCTDQAELRAPDSLHSMIHSHTQTRTCELSTKSSCISSIVLCRTTTLSILLSTMPCDGNELI